MDFAATAQAAQSAATVAAQLSSGRVLRAHTSSNVSADTCATDTHDTANPHGDVGLTQTSSYWTVTVNSFTSSTGTQIFTPKAGDVYVINVTVVNNDTIAHDANPDSLFALRNSQGHGTTYRAARRHSFLQRNGDPRRAVARRYHLEVPKSQTAFTLQFQPSYTDTHRYCTVELEPLKEWHHIHSARPYDEKLKRNEEGDVDPYSEPILCFIILSSFLPCIIGLAEEPYYHLPFRCDCPGIAYLLFRKRAPCHDIMQTALFHFSFRVV